MKITKSLLAFSLLAFTIPSFAGSAADQIERDMGAKILSKGPSRVPGLTAILAEKDGKKRVFYESGDGMYLFYGAIYDSAGISLTTLDAANLAGNGGAASAAAAQPAAKPQTAVAKPVSADAEAALSAAMASNKVTTGAGAKQVYIVFDPQCPYCKKLHVNLKNYAGNTTIHWIPVGVLSKVGGASHRKAAQFLSNPKIGLQDFNAIADANPGQQWMDKATQNVKVLLDSNSDAVPLVIHGKPGSAQLVRGVPNESEMQAIFGGK